MLNLFEGATPSTKGFAGFFQTHVMFSNQNVKLESQSNSKGVPISTQFVFQCCCVHHLDEFGNPKSSLFWPPERRQDAHRFCPLCTYLSCLMPWTRLVDHISEPSLKLKSLLEQLKARTISTLFVNVDPVTGDPLPNLPLSWEEGTSTDSDGKLLAVVDWTGSLSSLFPMFDSRDTPTM